MNDYLIPIIKFKSWFEEEKAASKLEHPAACCLSTLGIDGYPNARFVALKEVRDNLFIFTRDHRSRKGIELNETPKAALTFWWHATQRQVRIQGDVKPIGQELAEQYFERRSLESQLLSLVSEQGQVLASEEKLRESLHEKKEQQQNTPLSKPKHWGGFYIYPTRIEFMQFQSSRFHERELYEKTNAWKRTMLQP